MTLLAALAALEQEMRNRAAYLREHCFDKREDGEAEGVKSCADELVALRVRFEGGGWRPIDTAPSGTVILCCAMDTTEVRTLFYVDWLVDGKLCGDRSRPKPTHWMPLPAPPGPDQEPVKETR